MLGRARHNGVERLVLQWLAVVETHFCKCVWCWCVCVLQVVRDGEGGLLGLVDYATADDMATAIKKLDDTEFRNPYDK